MNMPRIQIRRAGPDDQAAIEALVRSEHLKPTDLRWPNFVVACEGERLVGAVQMITPRRHATHFERWGFRPVAALRSPLSVRLHWVVGQSMSLWSLLRRRPARRLAVLGRRLG